MIDYLQYFFISSLLPVGIIYRERKNAAKYCWLGVFTVVAAALAEPVGKLAGFWDYSAGPLLFGAHLLTILNYFNYIILVYFISEKIAGRFS